MTDIVVKKLEEAFVWGCSDLEACDCMIKATNIAGGFSLLY